MSKLQRARFAVFGYFLVGGSALGIWAVHIPEIEQRLQISHATIGWLLLLLGAGAFLAMNTVGWLVDHIGSRFSTVLGGTLAGLTLLIPAWAPDVFVLAIGMFLLGIGLGAVDVSMNAHGLEVEQAYGRPIYSAFHALWSAGGMVGGAVGAAALSIGMPASETITITGSILATGSLLMGFWLLPAGPSIAKAHSMEERQDAKSANRSIFGYVVLLGALSAASAIAEGSAVDWSALHATSVLGLPSSQAAWSLFTFSMSMTVMRLLADRIVARFGQVFVIRFGSYLGGIGLLIVAFAPGQGIALIGWAVLGIGISGVIPQLFAAASNIGEASHAGRNLAKVVGITYVGVLAGPAIIGLLTTWFPLNQALLFGALLSFGVGLLSFGIRPKTSFQK